MFLFPLSSERATAVSSTELQNPSKQTKTNKKRGQVPHGNIRKDEAGVFDAPDDLLSVLQAQQL